MWTKNVALTALSLGLLAGPATAQSDSQAAVRPLRFSAQRADASAACPDEAALRAAVAGRMGFDPFDPLAPAMLAVAIEPKGSGHAASVALIDEAGTKKARQLAGVRGDCADLAEALALSLTVAVEAFFASPRPEPAAPVPPAPVPPGPVPPAPVPAAPEAPPAVKATAPWLSRGLLRGGVAVGSAPSPAGVLGFGAGVGRGVLSGLIEARFQLPAGTAVETGRIDVATISGELLPCVELRPLRACGIAAFGALFSWATALAEARSAVHPLVALGARVELTTPLWWRLQVSAFAETRGALTRSVLRVGTTDVWASPPVSGTFGIAVAAQWGVTDSR